MIRKRVELETWISHPCLVSGEIVNWRQNNQKNDLAICLKNCQIEGSDWVESTDHLWTYIHLDLWQKKKSRFGKLQVGRSIAYLGRVEVYRRSDGTSDLGVKHDPELVRLSTYLKKRDKLSLEKRLDLHNRNAIINDFRSNPKQDLDYYRSIIAKDKIEVEQGIARLSIGHGVDRAQLGLTIQTGRRIHARGFKNV